MAKTKGPLFSTSASGSIARSITMRQTKNGQVAVRHSSPYSKNGGSASVDQLAQRAVYKLLLIDWHNLSQGDKNDYKLLGDPLNLTGWQMFVKTGGALSIPAAIDFSDSSVSEFGLTLNACSQDNFDYTNLTVPEDCNLIVASVTGTMTLPFSAVWDYGDSNQSMVPVVSSASAAPFMQVFILPNPVVGSKVMRVNFDSGRSFGPVDIDLVYLKNVDVIDPVVGVDSFVSDIAGQSVISGADGDLMLLFLGSLSSIGSSSGGTQISNRFSIGVAPCFALSQTIVSAYDKGVNGVFTVGYGSAENNLVGAGILLRAGV